MRRITHLLAIAWVSSLFFIGCSENKGYVNDPSLSHILTYDLVTSSYTIADALLSRSKIQIDKDSTLLVASFANIDNLTESSTFGRMIAEQVASRLSQKGYRVIDMRLRNQSVFMEEGKGEFLLSRNLKEVSKNHNAAAVVVGTYGDSLKGIYVSARIVNPSDSSIISSCDYDLQMGRATDILMLK